MVEGKWLEWKGLKGMVRMERVLNIPVVSLNDFAGMWGMGWEWEGGGGGGGVVVREESG